MILVSGSHETTLASDHLVSAVENPQTDAETEKQTASMEEKRREATRAEDAAAEEQDIPASGSTVLTSTPQHTDDFQEELVVRPLHSGDIYASFQFRTLWQTDFMSGNKGMFVCLSLAVYIVIFLNVKSYNPYFVIII